jgi:predicted DNA-binding transcriptional regulator AlpA
MSKDQIQIRIPATGFLRLHQVLLIIPVGKSSWWRGVKAGRYPKPVKIAPRTTAWRAEDITALVESFSGTEALKTGSGDGK